MTSLLGMIPLLAIGMNYYRYQNVDPENKVQEPQVVSFSYFGIKRIEILKYACFYVTGKTPI